MLLDSGYVLSGNAVENALSTCAIREKNAANDMQRAYWSGAMEAIHCLIAPRPDTGNDNLGKTLTFGEAMEYAMRGVNWHRDGAAISRERKQHDQMG